MTDGNKISFKSAGNILKLDCGVSCTTNKDILNTLKIFDFVVCKLYFHKAVNLKIILLILYEDTNILQQIDIDFCRTTEGFRVNGVHKFRNKSLFLLKFSREMVVKDCVVFSMKLKE